jgi:hypothetical protein
MELQRSNHDFWTYFYIPMSEFIKSLDAEHRDLYFEVLERAQIENLEYDRTSAPESAVTLAEHLGIPKTRELIERAFKAGSESFSDVLRPYLTAISK